MNYISYVTEKYFDTEIPQFARLVKEVLEEMDGKNYFNIKYDYSEMFNNAKRIAKFALNDTPSYKWAMMQHYQSAECANYKVAYEWFLEDLCDAVADIAEKDYR